MKSQLQQEIHFDEMISHHENPSLANILPRHGSHSSQVSGDVLTPEDDQDVLTIKAVLTVIATAGGFLSTLGITRHLEDLLGKTFLLELVSTELDSETGTEKEAIKGKLRRVRRNVKEIIYETRFTIRPGFGEIGAVLLQNLHCREAYIQTIHLTGFPNGSTVTLLCTSWVHPNHLNAQKRVFFTNKSYLPSETPSGLKRLREMERQILRGNGEGGRKKSDRIYDYDKYNDLGDPDNNLTRPVLGGTELPYPRRCRTGRPHTKTDPLSEETSSDIYIPRDEAFSEVKHLTFSGKTIKSVLHALLPQLKAALIDQDLGFPLFTEIDSLFNEGITLPKPNTIGFFRSVILKIVKTVCDGKKDIFLFETPAMLDRDKFSWFRDEEFSRQTLAGLNPFSIELVKEWPLKSKLDPEIYGSVESLITTELVEKEIKGFMTVNEALEKKKLFLLDYHDLLIPLVNIVREIEGTTLYGSRTLFFLTENGCLRPIAIELTRPPLDDKPQWKQVFIPCWDATGVWLWRLAKAHVCAHDSGYHQLVIHWLRTHCVTEAYIIAANRQMSAMHPIYRLLCPHFRFTMEINAQARESLLNADGVIESCFSPGKYSMELSSAAYDKLWRFDMESLPADLIRRGMAVEDPTAKHGLKLTIEDYPFANDGLILWDAIKKWVGDYVNHYYQDASVVECDQELQDWWTEVRTKGHEDKQDEPWWPVLKTPEDLIHVLTTIIWVASGHHAAVNFGQYTYAGYFPNRPTIARTIMPCEDPSNESFKAFLAKPETTLLKCFPSKIQATTVMAVLDVLSEHSPDEEYIGEISEPSWTENPVIKDAFGFFKDSLKELEKVIDERNGDTNLRNRVGAGVVPYELLKPFSKPGVTGMGVPNSISI
ncbi:linoleate 13S-lipoxygenase 2-1, chloroplastic-like [Argentina anserina]|uniref:linoleate 13S-lipoxygenase 2-1, chloroplastic-like n=1 Tax=Argentina anserina TaxID=57926 RepID=UPI0021765DCC|nr:linoleate 13S-lipoxygenase 2-1, chloroplastic-like [Potentilla anserina]